MRTWEPFLSMDPANKRKKMYKNSVSLFPEILEDNRLQVVKEHYDGHFDYNSRRETTTSTFAVTTDILAQKPGQKLRKIHATVAKKYPFEWPGEPSFGVEDPTYTAIPNFDTSQYNTGKHRN
jgi:hypothetical protein